MQAPPADEDGAERCGSSTASPSASTAPKAWSEQLTIDWHFTDLGERYRMSLSNGVLVHYPNPGPGGADLSLTLTKPQLLAMLAGGGPEDVEHNGDPGALQRLLSVLDTAPAISAIVTP